MHALEFQVAFRHLHRLCAFFIVSVRNCTCLFGGRYPVQTTMQLVRSALRCISVLSAFPKCIWDPPWFFSRLYFTSVDHGSANLSNAIHIRNYPSIRHVSLPGWVRVSVVFALVTTCRNWADFIILLLLYENRSGSRAKKRRIQYSVGHCTRQLSLSKVCRPLADRKYKLIRILLILNFSGIESSFW